MFARSISIMGDPNALDGAIAYVRQDVIVSVMACDGAIGLSMLSDRETGHCIVTSSWRDAESMHASRADLAPVRMRTGDILGSPPQTEEWEVAVMHRDHHSMEGACCRATWLRFDKGTMDQALDVYRYVILPALEELDGFGSASLLINKELGRACSTVTFDTREAMEASRERSWAIREHGIRETGVDVLDTAEYDLVVAHLHLPEMV
ncbi:hypothetical protein [Nocardioides limicola]|uniref:hypothetical protein n=1 Tax=Nocardioides limicola TaxID=2803368 RepID=UPI00193B08DC|nr:hypothetical protein [Nocardioides sp. DJM-14]